MSGPSIIILGAGRPLHGQAAASRRLLERGQNVLQWQLQALQGLAGSVQFVGGFEFGESVVGEAEVHYHYNSQWASTGSVHSLFQCELAPGKDTLICYADVVFRPELVAELAQGRDAIRIAVDRRCQARRRASREMLRLDPAGAITAFGRQDALHGEEAGAGGLADFVGMVYVPGALLDPLRRAGEEAATALAGAHLSALMQRLLQQGLPLQAVDAAGRWMDLDDDAALSRFLFGTKAETLGRLAPRVIRSRILPQSVFTVQRWQDQPDRVVNEILARHAGTALAIRSSSTLEDGFESSAAGRYSSRLNVPPAPAAIRDAVSEVVGSYDAPSPGHQVLVQPMAEGVCMSGVVTSRVVGSGAPYFVINYSLGARTDQVTAGDGASESAYVYRRDALTSGTLSPALDAVLAAAVEIEYLTGQDALDIEFTADAAHRVSVLQVRPLVIARSRTLDDEQAIEREVDGARALFEALQEAPATVAGARTLFGTMPDWNPAEIIGVVPSPLAASLYRRLVTDQVWALQRREFGYRDLVGTPLLRSFAGHPYIDVRASINSFLPAGVSRPLAARLVDAALDRLQARPHLHDKLEFQVVPTCLDHDFGRWDSDLFDAAGVGDDERRQLEQAYRAITLNAPHVCQAARQASSAYDAELDGLLGAHPGAPLEAHPDAPLEAHPGAHPDAACCAPSARQLLGPGPALDALRALLGGCASRGVLPFAHLARCGFVAVSLLRSACARGAIDSQRMADFLRSVRTVGHALLDDARRVARGERTFQAFCSRYGHLRPGSYDILSPTYAQEPDTFLRPLVAAAEEHAADPPFEWSAKEREAWRQLGRESGVMQEPEALSAFLHDAIEGREFGKFVFSRALSRALDAIAVLGEGWQLSRDDMACLELEDMLQMAVGAGAGTRHGLQARVEAGRQRWHCARHIHLPPLLCTAGDFSAFQPPALRGNFITARRVRGDTHALDARTPGNGELSGRIALVVGADPGYEWLFGQRIAGLITAYGGINSHMAIRCAEFGLPAAIGVGEQTLAQLSGAEALELDCGARRITVLR